MLTLISTLPCFHHLRTLTLFTHGKNDVHSTL